MAIEAVGLIDPVKQFVDENGAPYASGTLGFYTVGTSTLLAVYSDPALTTPLTNPVPLNAAGRTSTSSTGTATGVYCQQQPYDYILRNASGTTIEGPITFSGSQWPGQVQGQAVLSPAINANGYTNRFTTTLNKAASGTHALFAGTRFDIPTIGAGGSTLTESDTVYIEGAPATGTQANALHVAAGAARFDGNVFVNGGQISQGIGQVNFRLTLTTGTPVTTADVTAATTLYAAPYQGNAIALYSGSVWNTYASTEMSIAVPASTSQMYDVFCYDNSGTPTLELLAWTNDTTRATALTTQNGVLVKTGATTRRFLGSMRTTTVSGQTEDSATKRYVSNYYNRVPRPLLRQESTASWNYSTNTIRQANAAAANQVDVVVGWAEVPITVNLSAMAANGAAMVMGVGIGEDSTTVISPSQIGGGGGSPVTAGSAQTPGLMAAVLKKYPAVGRHYYAWLEWSASTGTTTWYGAPQAPSGVTGSVSGLNGEILG